MVPKSDLTILDALYLVGVAKNLTGKTTSSGFDQLIENPDYGLEFLSQYFEIDEENIIGNQVVEALDTFLEDYGYKTSTLDSITKFYEEGELDKNEVYKLLHKEGFKHYTQYNGLYIISRVEFTDDFERLDYLFSTQKEPEQNVKTKEQEREHSPSRKITPGRETDLTKHKRSGTTKKGKTSRSAYRKVKGETKSKERVAPSRMRQADTGEVPDRKVRSNRSLGINERKYVKSLNEFLNEQKSSE